MIVVVAVLPLVAWTLPWHRSPEYALSQIRGIKTPAGIIDHKDYVTDQGADTLRVLMPILDEFPFEPTFDQVVYWPRAGETTSGPETSDYCTISFSGGKTAGQLVFRHAEVWQLDDVYLRIANGQNFNLNVSSLAKPLQVLENAMAEKTKESVDADHLNFTEQGKRVRLMMISKGSQGPKHPSMQVKVPMVDDHTVAFPMADDHDELQFRVVNDGGWRFDDIYAVKLDGHPVNLTVSYAMDHPILTSIYAFFNGL